MKWLVGSLASVIFVLFFASSASAVESQIVIREVRLGGDAVLDLDSDTIPETKQYVVIHNLTNEAIDLASGWSVQYAKEGLANCAASEWSSSRALTGTLAAGEYLAVEFQLTDAKAGSLRVLDSQAVAHDTVGWGTTAPCYETAPTQIPANNTSLLRFANCDLSYLGADTNDNSLDFTSGQTPLEIVKFLDCVPDCTSEQQLVDGVCTDDKCSNIEGFQMAVPDGYHLGDTGCIVLPVFHVTELLPNASGSDSGNEFIEFYNPNDEPIDLSLYRFYIGDISVQYAFNDTTLPAKSYIVVRNDVYGFTLNNTSSRVGIVTIDGDEVNVSALYNSPADGETWASIDGVWQYTNQPSPGAANLSSVEEAVVVSVSTAELKPCAANQYRSLETNRCRLLATAESTLAPCKEGQYRSLETNRCRTATVANSLTPCKEGQYRSEETNRCRSIATSAKELVACKEGQERNPETNRCRNVAAAPGVADFAVEPVADSPSSFTGWWLLGGVGVLAAGWIGWEWRSEIAAAGRRIRSFFTPGK
jgi:hypothetical protein